MKCDVRLAKENIITRDYTWKEVIHVKLTEIKLLFLDKSVNMVHTCWRQWKPHARLTKSLRMQMHINSFTENAYVILKDS